MSGTCLRDTRVRSGTTPSRCVPRLVLWRTSTDAALQFGKQLGAWARGTGWRAYSPDMVIGGRVQYPGYSTSTIRAISASA